MEKYNDQRDYNTNSVARVAIRAKKTAMVKTCHSTDKGHLQI